MKLVILKDTKSFKLPEMLDVEHGDSDTLVWNHIVGMVGSDDWCKDPETRCHFCKNIQRRIESMNGWTIK